MNLHAPVSSLMTRDVISVHPNEFLGKVKEIFDTHQIHHIPVVSDRKIVGMISKTDFLHFVRGIHHSTYDEFIEKSRLRTYRAEDIMTKGLAKLEPTDKINVALEVFKENLFHAIPICEHNELVGILTTLDIIKALSKEDQPVRMIEES